MPGFNTSLRHRAIKRIGFPVTIYNYSWDGSTDSHGDPAPGSFTETTANTHAVMERGQDPEQVISVQESGEEIQEMVRFLVPDDIDVHIASDADRTKGTIIEIDDSGRQYRVYEEYDDEKGVIACLCRRDE